MLVPFGPHSTYRPLCWAHTVYASGKFYLKMVCGFSWGGRVKKKIRRHWNLEPAFLGPSVTCSGVAGIMVWKWLQTVPVLHHPHSCRALLWGLPWVCCWRKLLRVSLPRDLWAADGEECGSQVTWWGAEYSAVKFRAQEFPGGTRLKLPSVRLFQRLNL